MSSNIEFVLVTGATGFIGAHVVDTLLSRGLRVRGAARSKSRGEEMIRARPEYAGKLEFVEIKDFAEPGGLEDAVKDVDAVIHVASPFSYNTTNHEQELVIPAINGVNAILSAATTNPRIQRMVITSSFASVIHVGRKGPPYFTYTAADWNPTSYEDAVGPDSNAVTAYRVSKKYAELEAWKFVKEHNPSFDIVTLCPPMVFGPVVHPLGSLEQLNESNVALWEIAKGLSPLPVGRVPFWIDVRDLAVAHVQAVFTKGAGGKRFIPAAPERWSYGLAAKFMVEEFPGLRGTVNGEEQEIEMSFGIDGETAGRELGYSYQTFRETVRDFIARCMELQDKLKV